MKKTYCDICDDEIIQGHAEFNVIEWDINITGYVITVMPDIPRAIPNRHEWCASCYDKFKELYDSLRPTVKEEDKK